jgi:hypothetical protein
LVMGSSSAMGFFPRFFIHCPITNPIKQATTKKIKDSKL